MFSRVNWKQSSLASSVTIRDLLCDGVKKGVVIPLVTRRRSVPQSAWAVDLSILFNIGLIPRIYLSAERTQLSETNEDIISRSKVTYREPDARFSVRSSKKDRVTLRITYASSSSVTAPQPAA